MLGQITVIINEALHDDKALMIATGNSMHSLERCSDDGPEIISEIRVC